MVWYLLICMYIVNQDYNASVGNRSNILQINAVTLSKKDKSSTNNLKSTSTLNLTTTSSTNTQASTANSSKLHINNIVWKFVLPLYGVIFTVLHFIFKTTTAFQIHFGVLLGVVLFRIFQKYKKQYLELKFNQKFIIYLYLFSGLLAFLFWLIDYNHCSFFHLKSIYPFGHVLWHVFMGYSAYCSVLMIKILDMMKVGQELMVVYKFGIIPTTYGISSDNNEKDVENNMF